MSTDDMYRDDDLQAGTAPDGSACPQLHDFSRLDERDDGLFYRRDRFVQHADSAAVAVVEQVIGQLIVEGAPAILDLMASWDSHLPGSVRPAHVAGLGLNENELKRNAALTEYAVHDLNREPRLPFADNTFDVVLNTFSIDYVTDPAALFGEVRRILRPNGLFLVIFTNRFFRTKAVKVWRDAGDGVRVEYVRRLFEREGGFGPVRVFSCTGRPRPRGDRFARLGIPSDPIYAVYADRTGPGPARQRPVPVIAGQKGADRDELARRMRAVKESLLCPHCLQRLARWDVPQHPFTQWDNEFMYVCFNDACPYYTRSWDTMQRQGNVGMSYRLMYNPANDRCMAAPVPSLGDRRLSNRG